MKLLGFIALICIPCCVSASCSFAPLIEGIVGENTQWEYRFKYCEYQDSVLFPVGHFHVDDEACQNCTCNTDGMSCCSYGYHAGPMYIDKSTGCKIKKVNKCDYEIVKVDDEDVLCGQQ